MKPFPTQFIKPKVTSHFVFLAILGLTASYSHAQDNDFTNALEARVAARWDYEAERQKTLLDKDKFTVFLAGTGSPTNRNRLMSGTAVFAN